MILVVDDEALYREVLAKILTKAVIVSSLITQPVCQKTWERTKFRRSSIPPKTTRPNVFGGSVTSEHGKSIGKVP